MRVGIYIGKIQDVTIGGGATFQLSIVNELVKTNSNHELFIFYDSPEKLFEDNENIKFVNMDVKLPSKNIQNLFGLRKQAKRHFLNEQVLENNIELVWCLVPVCPFVEAPYVLTIWDLQHRLQAYFPEVSLSGWTFDEREKFYGNAIQKASYVVIGNNDGANQIEKFYGFPNERIKRIPLPTPDFVFSKQVDDSILAKNELEKNKYLFYPAQFWPHKNHIRILKALKILKDKGINVKLALSGTDKGNKNYIKQKVKEYGLEKNVKFLGFVSEAELISLYKNAFALTFASMFGPDNIPPLEAMALSCPVICSDIKGMREQLDNAALFFNPLDEHSLVIELCRLLESPTLQEELIKKGQEKAHLYKANSYVLKMIEVMDEFAPIRECWSNKEKYIYS